MGHFWKYTRLVDDREWKCSYFNSVVVPRRERSVSLEATLAAIRRPALHETARKLIKREVVVTYRSVQVSLLVNDLQEEIDLKVAAVLKSQAVGQGLSQLPGEGVYFDGVKPETKVDSALVANFESARKVALGALKQVQVPNFRLVVDVLERKHKALVELDNTWKIEAAVMKHLMQNAHTKLETAALDLLPSSTSTVTLAEAC
eukprot:2521896-Amphidinium_carterae.1